MQPLQSNSSSHHSGVGRAMPSSSSSPSRRPLPLALIAIIFICAILTTYFVASSQSPPTVGGGGGGDDYHHGGDDGGSAAVVARLRAQLGESERSVAALKSRVASLQAEAGGNVNKNALVVPPSSSSSSPPSPPIVGGAAAAAGGGEEMITVVLMSYPGSSRFHLLKKIIERVTSWPFVYEVLLVWNGPEDGIPQDIRALADGGVEHDSVPLELPDGGADDHYVPPKSGAAEGKEARAPDDEGSSSPNKRRPPLTILPQTLNRVDNRWRIGRRVRTVGVLNMDDDIDLRTDGAQCLFDVWKASPEAVVGIDVRSHYAHKEKSGAEKGPFGHYGYAARDTSTRGVKKFSITLPRSLLTNRQHFLAYDRAWRDNSTRVRSIVDTLLCDDIAFNFVANSHHSIPLSIYAKANYDSYPESNGAGAMMKKPGMKAMRQRCVNELGAALGMTLKHRYWHVLCSVDG